MWIKLLSEAMIQISADEARMILNALSEHRSLLDDTSDIKEQK